MQAKTLTAGKTEEVKAAIEIEDNDPGIPAIHLDKIL